MDAIILNKLAEVAQQQATAAQSQAVSAERMAGIMESIDKALDRAELERDTLHVMTRAHVDTAARQIVSAISADSSARDGWWKKMAAIIAIIQIINAFVNFIKK